METRKVLAIVGLVWVLIGFCLPWIQPAIDRLSGLDISLLMLKRALMGLEPDVLPALLILVPVFSGFTLYFFSHHNRMWPVLSALLADLIFAGVFYIMGDHMDNATYGFYICTAGLGVLNISVFSLFVRV